MCVMSNRWTVIYFFFFQAEDGIRDLTVTGVQTCALPIYSFSSTILLAVFLMKDTHATYRLEALWKTDRKSTRLNSSHSQISYAVFCLKKKKTKHEQLSIDYECFLDTIVRDSA